MSFSIKVGANVNTAEQTVHSPCTSKGFAWWMRRRVVNRDNSRVCRKSARTLADLSDGGKSHTSAASYVLRYPFHIMESTQAKVAREKKLAAGSFEGLVLCIPSSEYSTI